MRWHTDCRARWVLQCCLQQNSRRDAQGSAHHRLRHRGFICVGVISHPAPAQYIYWNIKGVISTPHLRPASHGLDFLPEDMHQPNSLSKCGCCRQEDNCAGGSCRANECKRACTASMHGTTFLSVMVNTPGASSLKCCAARDDDQSRDCPCGCTCQAAGSEDVCSMLLAPAGLLQRGKKQITSPAQEGQPNLGPSDCGNRANAPFSAL